MNTSSHDFVTVDMRGLKAVLVARARADRVSVSALVRVAVARELGVPEPVESRPELVSADLALATAAVKLSIRMTQAEAKQLDAGARAAGLSRGAYLTGLGAGVPVLTNGASRLDHLAAIIASNAELATLSRNIHHPTALLRQGAVRAAQEYREMLDTLNGDVRAHLTLASTLLAEFRPRGRSPAASKHPAN